MVTIARVRSVIALLDGVEPELIAVVGRHANRAAPGHLDRHLVIEIERDGQDDLVARRRDRERDVHERHVGASRHHDPAAAPDIDVVFNGELLCDRRHERRDAGPIVVFVRRRLRQRVANGVERFGRRSVVHHALSERNGAGRLPNPAANHGDDGCLHPVHPRGESCRVHGAHVVRNYNSCACRAPRNSSPTWPACAWPSPSFDRQASRPRAHRSRRRNSLSGSRSAPTTSSRGGTRSSTT